MPILQMVTSTRGASSSGGGGGGGSGVTPYASVALMAAAATAALTGGSLFKVTGPIDAYYKYSSTLPTGLTTDATTCVAATVGTGYFVRLPIASVAAMYQAVWYVADTGNDATGDGLTLGTALQTPSEFYRRTGGNVPDGGALNIANDVADIDDLCWYFRCSTPTTASESTFYINGTNLAGGQTGTVSTYVVEVTTGGSQAVAHLNITGTTLANDTRICTYTAGQPHTADNLTSTIHVFKLISGTTYKVRVLGTGTPSNTDEYEVSAPPKVDAAIAKPRGMQVYWTNVWRQFALNLGDGETLDGCIISGGAGSVGGGTIINSMFISTSFSPANSNLAVNNCSASTPLIFVNCRTAIHDVVINESGSTCLTFSGGSADCGGGNIGLFGCTGAAWVMTNGFVGGHQSGSRIFYGKDNLVGMSCARDSNYLATGGYTTTAFTLTGTTEIQIGDSNSVCYAITSNVPGAAATCKAWATLHASPFSDTAIHGVTGCAMRKA